MKYIVGDVDEMQDFEIETDDIDVEASVVLIKEEENDNDMLFNWEHFNQLNSVAEKQLFLAAWMNSREIWYYDSQFYVKFTK